MVRVSPAKKERRTVVLRVDISADDADRLERLAADLGVPKPHVVRTLIHYARLEHLQDARIRRFNVSR